MVARNTEYTIPAVTRIRRVNGRVDLIARPNPRPNSQSTPSAQIEHPCSLLDSQSAAVEQAATNAITSRILDWKLRLLIEIMYSSGCRVSEALNVKGTDIGDYGTVFIKGLKRSHDITAEIHYNKTHAIRLSGKHIYIFQDLDRYYVHRQFKALGIYFPPTHSRKGISTHALRHLKLKKAYQVSMSVDTTRRAVNQKSEKATKNYIK